MTLYRKVLFIHRQIKRSTSQLERILNDQLNRMLDLVDSDNTFRTKHIDLFRLQNRGDNLLSTVKKLREDIDSYESSWSDFEQLCAAVKKDKTTEPHLFMQSLKDINILQSKFVRKLDAQHAMQEKKHTPSATLH